MACLIEILLILGTFALPIMVLTGSHEMSAPFRLRSGKLVLTLSLLLVANAFEGCLWFGQLQQVMQNAAQTADATQRVNQFTQAAAMRDLSSLFPDMLPDSRLTCIRAAMSNYVEDQWRAHYRQESCDIAPHICADDSISYRQSWLRARDGEGAHAGGVEIGLNAFSNGLHIDWLAARDAYPVLRRFTQSPDPKTGIVPPPPDEAMLADYTHDLDSCISRPAQSWSTGNDALAAYPAVCIGGCR